MKSAVKKFETITKFWRNWHSYFAHHLVYIKMFDYVVVKEMSSNWADAETNE